jgi:hypothetical protein
MQRESSDVISPRNQTRRSLVSICAILPTLLEDKSSDGLVGHLRWYVSLSASLFQFTLHWVDIKSNHPRLGKIIPPFFLIYSPQLTLSVGSSLHLLHIVVHTHIFIYLFSCTLLLRCGGYLWIYTQSVSPSQGLYLNTGQHKHRITRACTHTHTKHPCPKWDSNPRSQYPRERRQLTP